MVKGPKVSKDLTVSAPNTSKRLAVKSFKVPAVKSLTVPRDPTLNSLIDKLVEESILTSHVASRSLAIKSLEFPVINNLSIKNHAVPRGPMSKVLKRLTDQLMKELVLASHLLSRNRTPQSPTTLRDPTAPKELTAKSPVIPKNLRDKLSMPSKHLAGKAPREPTAKPLKSLRDKISTPSKHLKGKAPKEPASKPRRSLKAKGPKFLKILRDNIHKYHKSKPLAASKALAVPKLITSRMPEFPKDSKVTALLIPLHPTTKAY